jgi:O-antigen/teichoic acid export membrane protein
MRWALLGSLAAIVTAAYYFQSGNKVVAVALLFAAVFIPVMEPFGVFNAVLVGKRDFKLSSLLGMAGQIAAAGALVIALFTTNNPVIIFVVYCGAWTATRYVSLQLTLKKFPPNQKREEGAVSYALHSTAINAFSILISSLDAILVYHYLGANELALYTFAMAPVSHARAILNAPIALAVPKLAGQSTTNVRRMVAERTSALFLLGIALTIACCVVAAPFYHVFFPQYVDAIPYSLLFSGTILLQVGNSFVAAAVNSRVTLIPKSVLYLLNIPGIVTAVSALVLIQRFGLWGAMSGQLLACATSSAITWIMWYSIRYKEHATQQ